MSNPFYVLSFKHVLSFKWFLTCYLSFQRKIGIRKYQAMHCPSSLLLGIPITVGTCPQKVTRNKEKTKTKPRLDRWRQNKLFMTCHLKTIACQQTVHPPVRPKEAGEAARHAPWGSGSLCKERSVSAFSSSANAFRKGLLSPMHFLSLTVSQTVLRTPNWVSFS